MRWIGENLQIINTINKKNTVFELIDVFNMTVNPDFQVSADQFSSVLLESNWRFNVSGVSIKKLMHIAEKLHRLDSGATGIPAHTELNTHRCNYRYKRYGRDN